MREPKDAMQALHALNEVSFSGQNGRQVTVEGKAVTVWRREPEGVWKCVIDIWNDVSPSSVGAPLNARSLRGAGALPRD